MAASDGGPRGAPGAPGGAARRTAPARAPDRLAHRASGPADDLLGTVDAGRRAPGRGNSSAARRGFLAALSSRYGDRRGIGRDDLLAAIVRDTLPAEITAPRRKARFLEVFFRAPTREFVRSWDGTGADPELVDVDALRQLWTRWPIPGGTASLVQQLWLAANPAGPTDPARSSTDVEVTS
ncbi:hypothetical protein GCM10027614_11350 [Micromonospora vulcania]